MQPYVIKQGDYVAALAYQFGFDADTVWKDPSNAQLQQLRLNPNILFAGDVLYIPDQVDKPQAAHSLTPGSTNTFVTDPPTVTVTLQFSDPTLASQAYTLQELPQLTGLVTGADGLATFPVPVTQQVVTLVFTTPGTTVVCQIGNLDPVGTLSGNFQRLQNLGFIGPEVQFAQVSPEDIRSLLRFFKATRPPSGGPPSAPPSSGAVAASASGDSTPAPATPVSTSTSAPSSSPSLPPASGPSPDSSPASPSDPGKPWGGVDRTWLEADPGMADDGTLDPDLAEQLTTAHAC